MHYNWYILSSNERQVRFWDRYEGVYDHKLPVTPRWNVNRRPADENKRQMNIIHSTIGCFHDQRKKQSKQYYNRTISIQATVNYISKYKLKQGITGYARIQKKIRRGGGSDGCLPGVDRELGGSMGLFR